MAEGGLTHEECESRLERALSGGSFVKFMLEKMEEAGCSVPRTTSGGAASFFRVERCEKDIVGGFRPEAGVAVCHNHISSQTELETALTHELIHAYDHCRAKHMDWTNCEHHACSEIRAANLSGDCHMSQELARGNFGFYKQHQRCVKRRAALSVGMNPNCGNGRAAHAVDKVFDTCFNDTAPFAYVP